MKSIQFSRWIAQLATLKPRATQSVEILSFWGWRAVTGRNKSTQSLRALPRHCAAAVGLQRWSASVSV